MTQSQIYCDFDFYSNEDWDEYYKNCLSINKESHDIALAKKEALEDWDEQTQNDYEEFKYMLEEVLADVKDKFLEMYIIEAIEDVYQDVFKKSITIKTNN